MQPCRRISSSLLYKVSKERPTPPATPCWRQCAAKASSAVAWTKRGLGAMVLGPWLEQPAATKKKPIIGARSEIIRVLCVIITGPAIWPLNVNATNENTMFSGGYDTCNAVYAIRDKKKNTLSWLYSPSGSHTHCVWHAHAGGLAVSNPVRAVRMLFSRTLCYLGWCPVVSECMIPPFGRYFSLRVCK